MPVEIAKIRQESIGFVAQERLWLTSDGKTIVRDGDWRASQLLVAKGHVIPEKVAKRLGLEKGITILELETAPPKKTTTVSEEIESRSTRPERIQEKR